MDTETALAVVQERVDETPGKISVRDAMNEEIFGRRLLGVTLFDDAEFIEVPAAFVAFTVKVYAWPFVRPVSTIGLPAEDVEIFPGVEITV
jgi:hypothetical protein